MIYYFFLTIKNMRTILSSLALGFLIFSSVTLSQPLQQDGDDDDGDLVQHGGLEFGPKYAFAQKDDEDLPEDPDFEDEEIEEPLNLQGLLGPDGPNINSLGHFHEEKGEVLVPCFGMWWPVGGGPVYDYVGDYYGDYKKKRRRSRKQKKAARQKKKKS